MQSLKNAANFFTLSKRIFVFQLSATQEMMYGANLIQSDTKLISITINVIKKLT